MVQNWEVRNWEVTVRKTEITVDFLDYTVISHTVEFSKISRSQATYIFHWMVKSTVECVSPRTRNICNVYTLYSIDI